VTSRQTFLRPEDVEFFQRELESFVPDRVFDAHAHLCRPDFLDVGVPELPGRFGHDEYMYWIDCLHPGRQVGAFFLSFAHPSRAGAEVTEANAWTARHTAADPACRGAMFVRARDDPEWVRQEVRRLGLHGLKCYFTSAAVEDVWAADLPDYLPEPLVAVADQEGWPIVVHLVKPRAVADPSNIHWIRHYCRSYPNMKLILAHSARAFQPGHNLDGLGQLTDLGNLYFDTSANCRPFAHEVVLKLFGHRKLIYGSDSPICGLMRGTTVAVGDSFVWLTGDSPLWRQEYGRIRPVLLGLEHIRSLKWAAWSAGLDDGAIEDIFWNNAAELLALP